MRTSYTRRFLITAFIFFACALPSSRVLAAPIVITQDATFVDGTSATINGIVNPNGDPTVAWFQYNASGTFTNDSPKVYLNVLGSDVHAYNYSYRLNGLSSNKTFYFRVGAEQETSMPVYGGVLSFTTLAPNPSSPPGTQLPDVTLLPVSYLSSTSATLNASTNPHGFTTIGWFNYALDSGFQQGSNSVLFEDEGDGTTDKSFSYTLTDLTPSTRYFYRAGATHGDNESAYTYPQTFTTLAEGQTPITVTDNSVPDSNTGKPPVIAGPVIKDTGAIVTCVENCGYPELISMVQRIISFLLFDLTLPLAAAIFMYAGFNYLTSFGDENKVKTAKGAFKAVFKGLIVALAAWLIINTILTSLLTQEAQKNGGNLLKDSPAAAK
jgi:hypothetical protein